MGAKSQHSFNPCAAPKAQRLPAKIWELLRRNEFFRRDVEQLRALDKRAKEESAVYGEIARQYNRAVTGKTTARIAFIVGEGGVIEDVRADTDKNGAARIAEWQPRYDSVKARPIRNKTFGLIENYQKRHPLAALALQWLVPEPLFAACRVCEGQAEEGTGYSPDLNHPSWKWWRCNAPQGAISHDIVRGPEIGGNFQEWQNWRLGEALFDCTTPWNCLPKSFKSQFARVWRQNYDSKDAYEFNYLHAPRETDNLTRDDFARYLEFWETVNHCHLFAISPAILTTKDVGEVFARLQNRLKQKLPESREHLFGSEAAWRHFLAIKEKGLRLVEHIVGPGYKRKDSTEINEMVRNQRRNVQFGVKTVEKMIALIYPTFEFKKTVLVHSAPPRGKRKRRKPKTIASVPNSET